MSAQTKMIIITSNEDIIKQFSINKTKDTQIIDLDKNQSTKSVTNNNNNNVINLNLLAQLSSLNSTNDQVYKRALNSSDHSSSKSVKIAKKSSDLICTICGDHATGFNYNVLSCPSCKAFFRRNAYKDLETLRCLSVNGQCSISHDSRRKCARCRLNRCFTMGMRKDFILSEEEKQRRKKRLEENRSLSSKPLSVSDTTNSQSTPESTSPPLDEIDRFLMDIDEDEDKNFNENLNIIEDPLIDNLSIEDWITIENIQTSFLSIAKDDVAHCCSVDDISDRTSALIFWSQMANKLVLRFIDFFRKIDQFENLNSDDRFILIKYNIFTIFPIFKCIHFNIQNNLFTCGESPQSIKHQKFYRLCFDSNGIREKFLSLVLSLAHVTEQDPIILSLLLIILLFSQGLSMTDDEPMLKDSLAVYRAQSHYTKILSNYLNNKWGQLHSFKQLTNLLQIIFRMQTVTKEFREYFRDQFRATDSVNRIAPLMQSVLNIV